MHEVKEILNESYEDIITKYKEYLQKEIDNCYVGTPYGQIKQQVLINCKLNLERLLGNT